MKQIFSIVCAVFLGITQVFGWGSKGHDVIALIGEQHLSPKAKKAVLALLDNHRPVYYANWLDNVKSDPKHAGSSTWHYTNVNVGETYETMTRPETGDVVSGIQFSIAKLRDKQSNDSVKAQYLKYLIHLVADLHCPMHAGRATDLGGNRYSVKWMGQPTNLHKVWDELLPEKARNWSATEWVLFTDTNDMKLMREYAKGSPREWVEETIVLAADIYANTPENGNLSWDYLHRYSPLVESQFIKAGYRLASVLNSIFD